VDLPMRPSLPAGSGDPYEAVWLFRGALAVQPDHIIEISRFRFSYVRRAFEAQHIVDRSLATTYSADTGWDPMEPPWRDGLILGIAKDIAVHSFETTFRLEHPT